MARPLTGPDPSQDRIYARRWWILAVLALSLVIIGLDNTVLNVALPTLQRTFDATAAELQWMVDAYVLVFAGLLLLMGAIGDRFGRARALNLGLVIFGGASFAAIFATTAVQLIGVRAVMGVGGALIMPATLSIIANVFPREERGRAIAIWAGLSGLGIGLGPAVGGALIEVFDWTAVFLLNVPIALAALVGSLAIVPDSRDPSGRALDLPGAALSIGAVTVLVYGIIEAPSAGWTDPVIVGSFVLAAVLGALFAWRETHADAPMLDLKLFREPRFSAGAFAIGLTFFALFAMIFGLTQFFQFVLGKTPLEAGVLMLALAVGIPVGAQMSIRLVAHLGTRRVLAGALVVVAAVLASITFWTVSIDDWAIALTLFVLALAMANVMAPATASVMSAVPEARAGVGSAMNDLVRQLGGALGVAVIGSIINTVYRDQMAGVVTALPPVLAGAAQDSVGAATAIAAQVGGAAGEALGAAARTSFVDALTFAAPIAAGVALLTAALVARFMPARAAADTPADAAAVAAQTATAPSATPASPGARAAG